MQGEREIAVLLLAYGGPDSLEEVEPFVRSVRGGRPLPSRALERVKERYRRIGGRSPILERTRDQARALEEALGGPAGGFRAFVGMKNGSPTIPMAAQEIHRAGLERWIVVILAPHESRLSTGTYRERVEEAATSLDPRPRVDHVPGWHGDPTFLECLAARVREGVARFPEGEREGIGIVFTAHSLPERIREWNDPYPDQVRETAEGVMDRVGARPWRIAYQSQGQSSEPWLGPDLEETLEALRTDGVRGVLVAPIGFVVDHLEILYDIDIEARDLARGKGIRLERTESLNDDPGFIQALAGVVRRTAATGAGGEDS